MGAIHGTFRQLFILVLMCTGCDADPGHGGRSSRDWIRVLQTGDRAEKVRAAEALAKVLQIRPNYREVVEALALAVRDSVDEVRLAAASALSADGVDPLAAVAGLHEVLHDSAHADVRASIVLIIGSMGAERARPLLPTLSEALSDPDPRVRATALEAIGTIGSADTGQAQLVGRLAADSMPGVRRAALISLLNLRAPASFTVPIAKTALADSAAQVRNAAALTLGALGRDALPALTELTSALSDTDATVVRSVAFAIGSMGTAAASALPALRRAQREVPAEDKKLLLEAIANVTDAMPTSEQAGSSRLENRR
jgi:HEAT repeat protein